VDFGEIYWKNVEIWAILADFGQFWGNLGDFG
jgi:hypothetical protein